jgi:hypothetical protein
MSEKGMVPGFLKVTALYKAPIALWATSLSKKYKKLFVKQMVKNSILGLIFGQKLLKCNDTYIAASVTSITWAL